MPRLDRDENKVRAGNFILIFQECLNIFVPRRHLLQKTCFHFELQRVVAHRNGKNGQQGKDKHPSLEDNKFDGPHATPPDQVPRSDCACQSVPCLFSNQG